MARQLLNEFLDMINTIVKWACVILTGAMVAVILLQVFLRFVVNHPLPWTEEMARYCMIWMAFLGVSAVTRKWENMYVTFVLERIPPALSKAINILTKLSILLFLFWIAMESVRVMGRVSINQISPGLGIQMIWPQMGMIIGLALTVLQMLGTIADEIPRKKAAREELN